MPQSLSMVYVHAVFSTLGRRPYLDTAVLREDMNRFIAGVTERLASPAAALGGTADHLHLLVRLDRSITQADWVKEIKRTSSLWIKENHAALRDFHWQHGYALFSVSASQVAKVAQYIRDQETHHRRRGFQDELRTLMEKHGLTWDERYVWE